jgi:neutral ceramidase
VTDVFAAGAAAVSLEPPLGLPMVGFVRRHEPARWSVGDLEATAVALEADGERAVVVGVDTLAIQAPEIDVMRERIAQAVAAAPAAVLVNFNHTHCAPPACAGLARLGGSMDGPLAPAVAAYARLVADRVVDVATLAASRLDSARPAWGVGRCGEAVNRREALPDGRVILGWDPDGMVDHQVPVLQLRRRDGSVIATVVGYGCHTVAVGPDVLAYSADYPGPLRAAVRDWTGGECVFLQGAGGNILPRVAFCDDIAPARAMGRRLALAALEAVADRPAWPIRYARRDDGSVTPFHLYRPQASDGGPVALAAAQLDVDFPVLPLPTTAEVAEEIARAERRLEQARARGAGEAELNVIRYDLVWARTTAAALERGAVGDSVRGPVHALRIGDGAIVTGPGEIFSEIGLAVRERSPAEVTLYAGYTNGLVSYFPSAAAYAEGGYEPDYGNRSFGLPAQVAPECDRLLVRSGLDALARCFPGFAVREHDDLLASGAAPAVPSPSLPARPH